MALGLERRDMQPSFRDRHPSLREIPDENFPQSAALIPDKNRTYARFLGLPPIDGYLLGTQNALKILDEYADSPLQRVLAWAASVDNLTKRSPLEIKTFTMAVQQALKLKKGELVSSNRRFHHIGSKDPLVVPPGILETLADVEEATAENTGQELYLAFGYGEDDHKIRTSQRLVTMGAQLIRDNPSMTDEEINMLVNEDLVNSLYDAGGKWQNVDMLIRTYANEDAIRDSGGKFSRFHLSGIGDVVGSKTVIYTFPTPFPNLNFNHIDSAIVDFAETERNIGK